MSEQTKIIYSAGQIDEAVLLKQLLEERGIESFIENQALQGALGELPPGEATNPRVRVAEEDADKAREVVTAFERQQQAARRQPPDPEIEYVDDWADWPLCPSCHKRRQTVCPICGTAGVDLMLADPNHQGIAPVLGPNKEAGVPDLPLLLCNTCDEPFRPRFYETCQWCGHKHPDGIPSPHAGLPKEKLNPRIWAMAGGLGILIAGICGYFWWIAQ